ncbi:MAG: 6-hydroxymethylpterin diphosphokinase MptE-like protein [Campylobacterota bacterium]|nr:6-hydroxymethylpterin diphosphokinase MptE-like protein [Campylobacterota bacterium]
MDFEKIYEKNIKYLKNNFTQLYDKIIEADISHIELIVEGQNTNLKVNGQLIYPKDSFKHILTQVNTFLKTPLSYVKPPPRKNVNKKMDWMSVRYIKQIESISPYFNSEYQTFPGYISNLDSYPFVMMYGVGTGQHIDILSSLCDIKRLIIFDEDFSMLKISMHLVDWSVILEKFNQPGYTIDFKVGKKAEPLGYSAINHTYYYRPFYGYNIYSYVHYITPFFREISHSFKDKQEQIFNGWGFYDDEMLSLAHTVENIKKHIPIYNQRKKLTKGAVAFVVASGPSVDNDIEYIKKYKDDVVIFSAGTGISVLKSHGIKPDYHIEIERTFTTYDYLVRSFDKEYLKDIKLISINAMYPKVFELFDEHLICFRANDAGAAILTDDIPTIEHPNPTVANGALSIASDLGFDNIYMFGVDLGYKDKESHHSKSSVYFEKGTTLGNSYQNISGEVESNFSNGKLISDVTFDWGRTSIENLIITNINNKNEVNYYNCSDGSYIKGAIPLRSSEINIKKTSKMDLLEQIEKKFIKNKESIKKFDNNLLENLKIQEKVLFKTIENIQDIISKPVSNYSDLFNTLNRSYDLLIRTLNKNEASLTFTLLSGTMASMYSTIYAHSMAHNNSEEAMSFVNNGFKIVSSFLDEVKNDYKEKIRYES